MATLMTSRTVSVSIDCELGRVYEFVVDLEHLPEWAAAFCRSVKRVDGKWVIDTPQGPMRIRFVGRNDGGVLDHYVSPSPGVEIYVPMRVVRNGSGSEVLLTVFRQPEMLDAQYAQDLGMVEQDLKRLKQLLEGGRQPPTPAEEVAAVKRASTDHPIHSLIATRWSPYAFDDRPVSRADTLSLFEAARWAASSYNEQPWHYLLASQQEPEAFAKLLSCLVEGNQTWAKAAPLLAISVASLSFKLNGKPNKAAIHDLGLAAGNLTVEATARGLVVHQMIGILPERARELYVIPQGYEAVTGLAIGYVGDPTRLPEALSQRDLAPRPRRPLTEFIFGGRWGSASALVGSLASHHTVTVDQNGDEKLVFNGA